MQRFADHFKSATAAALLALVFAINAYANPTLEHIDGLPTAADNDVALSGDGKWFAWAYENDSVPWLTMVNLETGVQTTLDLELTTGFVGWDFPQTVHPDMNHDGSLIAVIADRSPGGGFYDDLAMVVNAAGAEVARLTGPDEYGDNAWFDKPIFLDASGRYVTFTTNATKLQPVIYGDTKSWSSSLEGWESAFRLDIQTGEIKLVAIKPGGAELKDYTYASGISDGGRFVLFESSASNLPGANGERQVYLRDMDSTAASAITLVSVDETGTPISDLACCSTEPDISDDGSRVIYTEEPRTTFLWTRDTGSSALTGSAIELTAVTNDEEISISGDGRWLTATGEDFSRLNIDSGSTDPNPDDGSGSPASIDEPKISMNGEVIIFWNSDLTKPDGEDGHWWLLRYTSGSLPPIVIAISETILVSDDIKTPLGITVSISEAITVTDNARAIPPLTISVSETITVSDDNVVIVGPTLADLIDLTLPPGPLVPGAVVTANAGGFKPFTPVKAFLQSDPVLVGEETADANGDVSFIIIIPDDFPPGDHTLILLGLDPDGNERRLTAAITVDSPELIFEGGFE